MPWPKQRLTKIPKFLHRLFRPLQQHLAQERALKNQLLRGLNSRYAGAGSFPVSGGRNKFADLPEAIGRHAAINGRSVPCFSGRIGRFLFKLTHYPSSGKNGPAWTKRRQRCWCFTSRMLIVIRRRKTSYCGRATSTGRLAAAGFTRRRTSLVQSFSVSSVRKPFSKSQTAQ
jgi:hypothetical protein